MGKLLKLKLVARSEVAGRGRVHWKINGRDDFPDTGQSVSYELPAGESWRELTVVLPIQGLPQIVGLYLPADKSPVELRSIRFQDTREREKAWEFADVKP